MGARTILVVLFANCERKPGSERHADMCVCCPVQKTLFGDAFVVVGAHFASVPETARILSLILFRGGELLGAHEVVAEVDDPGRLWRYVLAADFVCKVWVCDEVVMAYIRLSLLGDCFG